MLKIKDVSKFYNSNGITTLALEHINLEFKKGDIVAITGESGSGKSTLLNIICGNDSYDDGEIYFNGNETSYFDNDDLDRFRNKYVGFIYQNYNIIDSYTVLQNVMFPLLIKGYSYKEAYEKALELITKVGLKDRVKHKGTKLSGGEKQRVVIARALASDPEILACDEPTGNLDTKTANEIITLIKEIASDKLVLIVTHNYEQVKDIATRKVTLVDGKVIEDKELKEVNYVEDKEMVLEKQVISLKNILYFTKNNILATPKKTLFAFLILFVMTFAILSLFQGINYSYNTTKKYSYDNISYFGSDYLIFNKANKKPFSESELKYLQDLNYQFDYYELQQRDMINTDLVNLNYLNFIPEYDEIIGRLPKDDNECLLIASNYYLNELNYFVNYLDKEFKVYELNTKFKIVGVISNEYVNKTSFYTLNDYSKDLLSANFNDNLSAYLTNYSDQNILINKTDKSLNIEKITLHLPYGYEDYGNLVITLYDTYNIDLAFDVIYDKDIVKPFIYLPYDFSLDDIGIYEIGIKYDNLDSLINTLKDNNYNIYIPYNNSNSGLDMIITLIILTLISIVPVIFIYLITYLIFRTIYISKFREYTIMRIIGIDKRNMNKLFLIETFFVSFISSTITFIISIIIGYVFNVALYKQLNLYIVLVYFIMVFIFSLFLAIKINRRLFRYNTAKMLKDGVDYA